MAFFAQSKTRQSSVSDIFKLTKKSVIYDPKQKQTI